MAALLKLDAFDHAFCKNPFRPCFRSCVVPVAVSDSHEQNSLASFALVWPMLNVYLKYKDLTFERDNGGPSI